MTDTTERNHKKRSVICTLVVHALMLAVVWYFGFTTPLPLPDEQGILINFGTDNVGMGEQEPEQEQPQTAPTQPTPPISEPVEETYMTQDFEDAPVVAPEKPEKKEVKKQEEKEVVQEKPQPKEPEPEKEIVEERKVDQRSLFPGSSKESTSTSEGTGYQPGNMGDPSGDASAGSHQGVSGGGGGGGISFNLSGRVAQTLPVPEYNYQREGIVVVEITVNKEGFVTEATAGVRGSTTLDEYLLNVARRAALSARFDRSPNAPAFQKGTITYHFKLQ